MSAGVSTIAVLIPAYEPGPNLVALVDALRARGFQHIVVVDDGSGPEFAGWFGKIGELSGVTVLHHAVNLGKGAALKTGLNHTLTEIPGLVGVVTADADGQHDPEDILRVALKLQAHPEALVMGVRTWDKSAPWKSRVGNLATRMLLYMMIGQKLSDTQTGLRGVPSALIPHLLQTSSGGYEFELDMLIACKHRALPILEVPIRTIYLDGNRDTHFRPVLDSMKIYFLLFRFATLSLLTALIDNVVFILTLNATASIPQSQIVGRSCGMIFNYVGARGLVFHSQQAQSTVLPKYVLLVAGNGFLSYALIRWLQDSWDWQTVPAKLLAETSLFAVNFVLQRDFVFTRRQRPN